MNTFRQIIGQWPSLSEFAADIGVNYDTAKAMRRRDSIAPAHWPVIVEAAKRRGIRGVSLERLVRLHAEAAA